MRIKEKDDRRLLEAAVKIAPKPEAAKILDCSGNQGSPDMRIQLERPFEFTACEKSKLLNRKKRKDNLVTK